jgi:hypothetical protein
VISARVLEKCQELEQTEIEYFYTCGSHKYSIFILFFYYSPVISDRVLEKCQELEQTASVFDDLINLYKERKDVQGYRAVNDVKMLFERLFVTFSKG